MTSDSQFYYAKVAVLPCFDFDGGIYRADI